MAFDPDTFRQTLRRFGSGVTVVSAGHLGQVHGATASAFCSLSATPALILVCLDLKSNTRAIIDQVGYFGVNILSDVQRPVSDLFARKNVTPDDIAKIKHHHTENDVPILDDSIAWLECKVHAKYPGGDHEIYVGQVLSTDVRAARPLWYYDGKYRRMGGEMD